MTDHRHQPESDEADREKETTPIGVARDLAEEAEKQGGSTDAQKIDEDRLEQ